MLTDQYPCPTPRKHTPTHSTHTHTHKGTQMAPKRTHSAALQPSFVCCQFSSFLAIVPFVPSLSSSQSLSPSQSLLFLSCFFSSLPHCNLASTSAQNALHFCFYLPLFAILFFSFFRFHLPCIFSTQPPLQFFPALSQEAFFFTASCRLACTPHLWPVQKQISFFFCFPFFVVFFFVFLFCFSAAIHMHRPSTWLSRIAVAFAFEFCICLLLEFVF